jgi:hypothetical protein
MNPSVKWFLKLMIKPKEIKPGLVSSSTLLHSSRNNVDFVKDKPEISYYQEPTMGFVITGEKALEKR